MRFLFGCMVVLLAVFGGYTLMHDHKEDIDKSVSKAKSIASDVSETTGKAVDEGVRVKKRAEVVVDEVVVGGKKVYVSGKETYEETRKRLLQKLRELDEAENN